MTALIYVRSSSIRKWTVAVLGPFFTFPLPKCGSIKVIGALPMLFHAHPQPQAVNCPPHHPSPPHIRPSHLAWLDQSASPFPLIFSIKPQTWCRLPAAGPSGKAVTERYRICLASLVERRSPLPDLTVWSVSKAAPCDIRSKWQPFVAESRSLIA